MYTYYYKCPTHGILSDKQLENSWHKAGIPKRCHIKVKEKDNLEGYGECLKELKEIETLWEG